MISVVVIGARGYTGSELLPLLHRHPEFEVIAVGSGSAAGQPVSAHVSGMVGSDLVFSDIRPGSMDRYRSDACVLALPNGQAAGYVDALDNRKPDTVVVDLSADHRFDPAWAYGQPERFGSELIGATRIANPGCYATGAQLALAPLLDLLVGSTRGIRRVRLQRRGHDAIPEERSRRAGRQPVAVYTGRPSS